MIRALILALGMALTPPNHAPAWAAPKRPAVCAMFAIDAQASQPLADVDLPPVDRGCAAIERNGYLLPDPTCTPGAVNPTLTLDVLRDPRFTTKCVRDAATTAKQKAIVYQWYGIARPHNNSGKRQICELDHVVSLELGGADTLDNIFAQCGPSGVALRARFFKRKDTVENWLAAEVRAGRIPLAEAQRGIAADWTQYLHDATQGD